MDLTTTPVTLVDSRRRMPGLHDGMLLGMVTRVDTAAVFVQNASGEPFTIALRGVKWLHAFDFYAGNIIMDCMVTRDPGAMAEALDLLLLGESEKTGLPQHWASQIDGSHELLMLTPSYGATLVALASEVDVTSELVMP